LPEAGPLVHAHGAGRAVRVYLEADVRVAGLRRRLDHLGHERAGHAPAAPRPAGTDLAEVDPARVVVAAAEDEAGDLVTVEGDPGQVRPGALGTHRRGQPPVEFLALVATVVGERRP